MRIKLGKPEWHQLRSWWRREFQHRSSADVRRSGLDCSRHQCAANCADGYRDPFIDFSSTRRRSSAAVGVGVGRATRQIGAGQICSVQHVRWRGDSPEYLSSLLSHACSALCLPGRSSLTFVDCFASFRPSLALIWRPPSATQACLVRRLYPLSTVWLLAWLLPLRLCDDCNYTNVRRLSVRPSVRLADITDCFPAMRLRD